jgi:fatty-acyl-CoA synthase
MLLLGDILRRHARTRGDKTAYIVGAERLTYRSFHERSNRLARALRRLGVSRGDRIAVLSGNRAEYPIVYFAAIKLGAIVVPVNARFGADEVAYVIGHAEAETIFVAPEFLDLTRTIRSGGRLPALRRVLCLGAGSGGEAGLEDVANAESSDDVGATIDENDPHVLLYTSGTTGSPKGVLLSQRSYYLQAGASHLQIGLNEDDVGLSMFPMFHMGGWAMPLGFWHTGATAVIMAKADPRAILETVARERVTYLYAVPTVFRAMLALDDFERFDLGSLRLIGGGTAAMTGEEVREITQRFRCPRMVILYGATEAGPVSILRPPDVPRRPQTVGRPYLNVEVRLLDEAGSEVAPGAVGEIAVRSEFIMRGYWRNAEETARTVQDGWVHTGDLGVFDAEGFLSIVGRRKEVIRSAGENIFPVEIERVLLTHPDVREASVVGIPDPYWGEAAVAAVVLRDGAAPSAADLIEHVRAQLAAYKKPSHVCFLRELPRTAASQQVHKPLLRELILRELGR